MANTATEALGQTGIGSAWLKILDPKKAQWRKDPVLWAKERLGVTLWSKQRDIIEAVRDHSNTAVQSCHEIGKSFTAALTACWWLDTHDPGSAFVVTTAPTGPQVEAILWREINRMHKGSNLPGRTNLTEWYIGNEMVGLGRKPSDYNQSAFQGIHARYFLVIIDEACGVPKTIWDAASTLAANEHGKIFAIGNPDDPQSTFAQMCADDSGWKNITVGYEDTPNFTDEAASLPDFITEQLIHPRWVEDRKKVWGESSALFTSKCKGLFPTDADPFTVIPYGQVRACQQLELPIDTTLPIEAGIDVGGGGDRTVIALRQGSVALGMHEFLDSDPMRTVGRLCHLLKEYNVKRVRIDVIGIGWGVYGRIKELSSAHNTSSDVNAVHDAEVIAVNAGAKPSPGKEKRLLNKRAELWWDVGRELTRLQQWDLSRLDDDTVNELCSPKYEILDSYGKVKIEPKSEIKKRLGGLSPDKADALLLAFTETHHEVTIPVASALTQGTLVKSTNSAQKRKTLGYGGDRSMTDRRGGSGNSTNIGTWAASRSRRGLGR